MKSKRKAEPTLLDIEIYRRFFEEALYVPSDAVPRLKDAIAARQSRTGHWWNATELRELSDLVAQVVDALDEQEERIVNVGVRLQVQCATDVVRHALEHVQACYEDSSCNAALAIWRHRDIAESIAACKAELTTIIESFSVPREIEVPINGQGPPERIQMKTLKELGYDRVDSLYEYLLLNAKPKGDIMRVGKSIMDRATYNATVLAVVAVLKELRNEMPCFPVADLTNKLRVIRSFDGSPLDECYLGTLVNEDKPVIFRAVRGINLGSAVAQKAEELIKEKVHLWAELKHRNVHPIYGYITSSNELRGCSEHFGLISPFREKLNVTRPDYSWEGPRPKLRFLREAAAGMQYLHENNIVHGGLRASKLLLNDEGTVTVAYAGMTEIIDTLWDVEGAPWVRWCSPRSQEVWDAPEVDTPHGQRRTFKGDVWSFAMVMFEVFSGERPWKEWRRGRITVMYALYKNPDVRPERPKDEAMVTDEVWGLIQDCWKTNPDERPDFAEIHKRLEKAEAAFNEKNKSMPPNKSPGGLPRWPERFITPLPI